MPRRVNAAQGDLRCETCGTRFYAAAEANAHGNMYCSNCGDWTKAVEKRVYRCLLCDNPMTRLKRGGRLYCTNCGDYTHSM